MSLQFRSVLNDDWTKHSPPLGVSFLNCFPLLFNRPVMSDSATPRTAACQTSHLPKFAQVHIHCIGDTIQLSHPLMPSSPSPSLFPYIRVFSNESTVCIRWQNYWSFSFNIRPSNEYSGLISFKTDWFDLLAVQELSGVFSSTTVWKHQLFGTLPSLQSSSHNHMWPLGRP